MRARVYGKLGTCRLLPLSVVIGIGLAGGSVCQAAPPKQSAEKKSARAKPPHGATGATVTQGLIQAVKKDYLHLAAALLAKGGNPNSMDEKGRTLLMLAVQSGEPDSLGMTTKLGDPAMVELLLERGAKINACNSDGNTAFAFAALIGNKAICELLIDREADINLADKVGRTPLMLAVIASHPDIVELLLTKPVNINAKAQHGVTALALCVLLTKMQQERQKNKEDLAATVMSLMSLGGMLQEQMFANLLEKDADVNARLDGGVTMLMLVAEYGSEKMLRLTLNKGVEVNAQADDGTTALMTAAEAGNAPAVNLLLARGADPNHKMSSGETALMCAARKGRYAICERLLQKGADPKVENNAGETACALAEKASLTGIVPLLRPK